MFPASADPVLPRSPGLLAPPPPEAGPGGAPRRVSQEEYLARLERRIDRLHGGPNPSARRQIAEIEGYVASMGVSGLDGDAEDEDNVGILSGAVVEREYPSSVSVSGGSGGSGGEEGDDDGGCTQEWAGEESSEEEEEEDVVAAAAAAEKPAACGCASGCAVS